MEHVLDLLDGGLVRSRGRGIFQVVFGAIMTVAAVFWFLQGMRGGAFAPTANLLGVILLALGVEGLARGTGRLLPAGRTSPVTVLRLIGIVAWFACVVALAAGIYLYLGLTAAAIFLGVFLAIWALSRLILRNRKGSRVE